MMLRQEQVNDAIRYNTKKVGVLYNIADLGWPWSTAEPYAFVWATAFFQLQNGMKPDGKIGPQTLSVIKRSLDDTSVETPVRPKPDSDPPLYGKPSDDKYSNAVIVRGKRVPLPEDLLDVGLTASNYLDDDEPRFKRQKRSAKLVHFVLHETCGNTAKGCKNTLLKKGYGVQLILDPDGHLSCHGDLVFDRMVHANQINNTSFGVEIVNPYNPIYVVDEDLWKGTIPRQWWTWIPSIKIQGIAKLLKRKGLKKVPKRYVTPTPQQVGALRLLVPWLCEITGVQYRFPTKGLNKKKRQIDGLTMKPKGRPGPGVVAHRDFSSHSDGRFTLEDLLGRQE